MCFLRSINRLSLSIYYLFLFIFSNLSHLIPLSGLLMLIGLIVYISIFKAEIGSKLRPKSSLHPPLFVFKYGHSFFLYVLGFIFTELVGVLDVFLYITLEQIGHQKKVRKWLKVPIK